MSLERFDTLTLHTLRKKCQYSELFWSVFSPIPIRENGGQNNSEYGHFSRSDMAVLKVH